MAYEYKVGGQPVSLEVDPSLVAVRFVGSTRGEKAMALSTTGAGPLSTGLDLELAGMTIVAAPGAAHPLGWKAGAETYPVIAALEAQDAVAGAQPVFKLGDAHAVTCDRVIVGAEPGSDIAPLLADHGLELLSRENERVLARIPEGVDIFALVGALDADPRTLYAEPDFVVFGTHLPKSAAGAPPAVEAAAAADQYALQITGTIAAWAIQTGDPAITVAVLDDGVDVTHRDLAPAVVATYDAIDRDTYQIPNPSDWHGTACARLAVARMAGPGSVAGVGAGASLVAVRIAQSHRPRGPWETSAEIMAHAIDWAWSTGKADVISNSWGGPPSNPVLNAINRARAEGRGGRGAVVVVAAGNSGGAVMFPASLPDVLAVAASNQFDEAKTWNSSDNETFWASCLGPQIDIAAPGVRNRTTDVTGALGYSTSDYAPAFNGTSSSTPLVAGACALVLSRNPQLSEAQVRHLITATADKVGQFAYQNGRNDYLGHGRLNVLAAVNAA